MSDTIVTGEVRLSYVNIFNAISRDGNDPKYSVTILVPKTDVVTKQAIDNAIQQAMQEAINNGIQLPPNPATPVHDGDGIRQNGEEFGPECKGRWVFTASSKNKPEVVDKNVQPILSPTAVYSGCYGRVSIRFYPYNSHGRKGIGCGLGNVQKLRDGEPLGGGTTAKQDFGAPTQPATYSQQAQQSTAYPQQAQPMAYPQQAQPMAYPQQMQQPIAYPQQGNGYGFLGM